VLDHATVVTKTDFGLRSNEGLWASYNCLDLLVPTALCPPEEDPEVVKTFGSAAWVPGFQFAFQGGVECSALGLDKADQQAEVERVFALSEGKGVERALLLNRFVATPLVDPPDVTWEAPVDLTPATAVPVEVALALLEGYAAANYAGVPTIHMPRAAASLLGERIVWEGDKAYTLLGSKVAMGGGYDDADETVVGDWDLYATGEVYVERSESVGVQSYVLPGDGANDRGFDDNTVLSLAERMFRVGVDCFVAKATGTVWA
jgi:hypothetical protein